MTDSYLDEYSASMSEIRNTLNSLNDFSRKPYSPTSITSLGIPPVLTPGGGANSVMNIWDAIDTEQMGYLETSEIESVIAEFFTQAKSMCRSKFEDFEKDILSLLGNGVIGHVQKLKDKCIRRLDLRNEEFESNPRSYVLDLAQSLNLEGQGSLLRSEFCDKAPTALFGTLKGNEELESEHDSASMTKLVLHLESAERTNLRLREEMATLKQKLRELQTHNVHNKSSFYETQKSNEESLESLRSDKTKLVVEKETWNTLNENLQKENRRLIQENTRLAMVQNEMGQYQKEIETWKEKYVSAERQSNELRAQITSITMENERLQSEKDMFGFDKDAEYGLNVRRSPRNRLNLNKAPVGITVKTVYQNDVRCWDPPSQDCYQDLLHFVKTQYDSTYYISYADADGDSVRVTSDVDCRRAFEIAKLNQWESIKFQVELRAEIEVRNQYKDLELKHRKLKKQLQKLKKRTENSTYSTLKGRAVLDNMLSAFHHKALDEEMKDPIGRRGGTAGYVSSEQASLWSLKDTFARNVKSDLRSGWALLQIEVDDRKAISSAIGKKEFLSVRECISQHLMKTVQKLDGATFFDLHLCYMILLREQDEQSIKQVARSLLNVISDKDVLRENNISPIPGIDRVTCSAGAVMYNGEEDYLRWSRKADEALEYGKYHGANQVGNWEQYHSKKASRSRAAAKRLPGDVNQMDPYIENIVRQTLEGGATDYN